jgi:hypothetical protein
VTAPRAGISSGVKPDAMPALFSVFPHLEQEEFLVWKKKK